jgi:inositol phosphorylceramide mannosyltransferase catalytic subunit
LISAKITGDSTEPQKISLMTIPKIIHQTVKDKSDIHAIFRRNIAYLQANNETWDYRLYDNEDIRRFLYDEYDREVLRRWEKINPVFGPARADYFRYHLLYKLGGVYLDIKSTVTKRLDDVLRPDDSYILSHWNANYKNWGRYPELGAEGEYQQWHIIASQGHPFLEAVIAKVNTNIDTYDPHRDGVGKIGVLRVTGPITYTLTISEIQQKYPHRYVDIEELGFKYSIVETGKNQAAHEFYLGSHYRKSKALVILPEFVEKHGPTIVNPSRLNELYHCSGTLLRRLVTRLSKLLLPK